MQFYLQKNNIIIIITTIIIMKFYSQQGEDLFIYNNFINNNVSDGIFVELGAYNGLKYNVF